MNGTVKKVVRSPIGKPWAAPYSSSGPPAANRGAGAATAAAPPPMPLRGAGTAHPARTAMRTQVAANRR